MSIDSAVLSPHQNVAVVISGRCQQCVRPNLPQQVSSGGIEGHQQVKTSGEKHYSIFLVESGTAIARATGKITPPNLASVCVVGVQVIVVVSSNDKVMPQCWCRKVVIGWDLVSVVQCNDTENRL